VTRHHQLWGPVPNSLSNGGCFRQARTTTGVMPKEVISHHMPSYPVVVHAPWPEAGHRVERALRCGDHEQTSRGDGEQSRRYLGATRAPSTDHRILDANVLRDQGQEPGREHCVSATRATTFWPHRRAATVQQVGAAAVSPSPSRRWSVRGLTMRAWPPIHSRPEIRDERVGASVWCKRPRRPSTGHSGA
jgi:hypothetical protein